MGVGGIAGVTPLVSASEATKRYIIDTGDEVSEIDRARADETDLEVIHDLGNVGYLVVRGSEEEVKKIGYDYGPDVELERRFDIEVPSADEINTASAGSNETESTETTADLPDVSGIVEGFPEAYVWDAASMDLPGAHEITEGLKPNGQPVRIGIIDDGVYDHPDLNVDRAASVDLTGDGKDVLHPNEQHYHGTHVAGIAAANGGGDGDGVAPSDIDSNDCDQCSFVDGNLPFEDREISEADAVDKPGESTEAESEAEPDSVSIDNGSLEVDIGELSSGVGAPGGSDWFFDGTSTLYRETYGVRDGTNTHYDAENNGTVQSGFPASASPGDTVSATVTMPITTDSGTDVTIEMERRVTLDTTEPILRVEWEITNPSGETINDFRLSQYVDYDIDDVSGDYGKYFFDPETECEYIFLEDVSTGKLAGFTADVPSVNHGLTEYSTGIDRFTSDDPQFDNDDRQPDTGTDDVELAIEWSLGTIGPGESATFQNAFVYGNSEAEFQEQICGESPGEPAAAAGRKGVAPAAEIVSMRFFSSGDTSNFFGNFAAAVAAAIISDCDVINASLGFIIDLPESRTYLVDYIQNYIEVLADRADEFGIVWVASAGNSTNNANELVPGAAKAEDVLSVSATGPTGIVRPGLNGPITGDPLQPPTTPSYFTTHGEDYVDVSAPGGSWDLYGSVDLTESGIRQFIAPDGVLSTYPPDTVAASLSANDPLPGYVMPDANGNIPYGFLQGTSMSAPQVTGVAALLKAKNPDWTAHQIRQVIKATAREVGKETYHGYGFVDPVAALQVDDPADVRGQLGNPDSDRRDDRGRNEANDGSPRNSSGGSSGDRDRGRGDDKDDDDEEDEDDSRDE